VLGEWAHTWQQHMAGAFVDSYVATIERSSDSSSTARLLLPGRSALTMLLRAFVLDKAMYELAYEINHRPDWVRIPLTGIVKLLD
jgi:predicted trehalose synthase